MAPSRSLQDHFQKARHPSSVTASDNGKTIARLSAPGDAFVDPQELYGPQSPNSVRMHFDTTPATDGVANSAHQVGDVILPEQDLHQDRQTQDWDGVYGSDTTAEILKNLPDRGKHAVRDTVRDNTSRRADQMTATDSDTLDPRRYLY